MHMIAEPSVKSLLIKMQFQGQPLATGTGFIMPSAKGPMPGPTHVPIIEIKDDMHDFV